MQAEKHNKELAVEANRPLALGTVGQDQGEPGAAQRWLSIQCNMIRGVSCGWVLRAAPDLQSIEIEASWPDQLPAVAELTQNALLSAERGKVYFQSIAASADSPAQTRVYYPAPFTIPGEEKLVVSLQMTDRDKKERQAVVNLLRWNGEWLKYALANQSSGSAGDTSALFLMAAACLDQEDFRSTAMTLVSELAARFDCQRVSLGLRKRRHIEVQVLSHSSRFKHETNLIQSIGAAMDEAVDQDKVIVYSKDDSRSGAITHAHAELAGHLAQGTICSVPITERSEIVGALTLERDQRAPLDDSDVHLIEQLLALVAPVLLLKYRDEQNLLVKTGRSMAQGCRRLFGPYRLKLKLTSLAAFVALALLLVVQGDWRVTADALVEGSVQRTIAAPIDGYVETAAIRAGDVVSVGQEMGTLDDGDLRLQRLKWSTLRQQMVSESREAMAKHDRAEVNILNAKIQQADAELKLLDEQLSRTRLLAPFDGIVIEGDLSQRLGTPVTRGEVLFKVAPLDDYRIVLKVDETDIAAVQPGQTGKLILASMPDHSLVLRLEKITAVSTAEEGRNFFRVEAHLVDSQEPLRPGMEGVGKIEVGQASLFWIWTRDLSNWLRLQLWTWWR